MGISGNRFLSLAEFLFDKIAESILDGKYKVGQKLVENAIQTEFEVSKSPVREALQMLINTGLVERKARKGCFVKRVTHDDIINNYMLRASLEGIAAQTAYEKVSPADTRELKSYYISMKDAAGKKDVRTYLNFHDKFQGFFSEKSGNDILADFCEKLRMQNMWYRLQFYTIDIAEDLHTHDDLITHFESRDLSPQDIRFLMEQHINIGLKNFREFFIEKKGARSNG